MLVVKVELVPLGIGEPVELGRMIIANDGKSDSLDIGNYNVKLGRKGQTSHRDIYRKPQREGSVKDHRRLALPVWSLVAKALRSVGF